MANDGGAAKKLARLNERFQSFYTDLEAEKAHRRALEHDRARALEERVDALEREVRAAAERAKSERREGMLKLEAALRDVEAKLSARAHATEERLSQSVSALTAAIESVHEALNVEVSQRKTEMDTLGVVTGRRVDDFVTSLDEERLARLEREAELIARVTGEMNEVKMRLDAEKNTREAAVGKLAATVEEVRHASAAGEGEFQHVVLEELSALKAGLKRERVERMEEDELIVQAVGEYSKSIQNGLRIANA